MSILDDVRDVLLHTEFPKGSGVHEAVNVTSADADKFSVVVSNRRQEIWLGPPLVKQVIIIRKHVTDACISAIMTLKATRQPFRLWVNDIEPLGGDYPKGSMQATLGFIAY